MDGVGRTPLLEREQQLAQLDALLTEAGTGEGSLAFVSGEAGAGKSALLRAFIESRSDARVLFGACDGVSTPRPLEPIHDMASSLSPEIAALLGQDGPARRRLFEQLLADIQARGPILFVVEDVHWSDEATLDLLRFLGRRVARLPALLIASYRDDRAGPFDALQIVIGDLATASRTQHIEVPPLSVAAVETLVSGRGIDPEVLHRLTGGNAFFVGEVLAAGETAVPTSVRDAVRARAGRLSERGLHALQAAAVLGTRIEPWLLAAVAGEHQLGIDEATDHGLLVRQAETIAFRHELTRLAVLDDLPLIRGVSLHRRALRFLGRSSDVDAARLAYHAEGAADGRSVARHAVTAGRRAAGLSAHAVAIAQFERALRFREHLTAEQRAELLERMSYELFLTNRLPEAHQARLEAIEVRDAHGDRLRHGDDLRYLSRVAWFMGRGREAWAHARAAVQRLEPLGESHELAMAWGNVAHLHMIAQELREALEWGERALALGRKLGDDEVICYALNNIGSAQLGAGLEEGRDKILESLRIAMHHQMQEHIDRALFNLGEADLAFHRYDNAERYLAECLEYTLSCDLERCQLLADASRAMARLEQGAWLDAERMARAVVEHPRVSPHGRIVALTVLARLGLRQGKADVARLLDDASALAEQAGDIGRRIMPASTRAEAAWLAGDHDAVADALLPLYGPAVERADPWAVGELASWLQRAGQLETPPSNVAEPYRLEIAGHPLAAARAWDALGNPYRAALCRYASRDPTQLRESHDALVELGAAATAQLVAARLRDLGAPVPRGPRPATRSHPARLTEREDEIAALVAQGLTNGEIGRRLVISEKTVGHHVSSILGKLGVRRRAEVAPALAERSPIPR